MTRQYIKSISDRLDDISSTGNDNYDDGSSTNDDSYKIDKYDDEYYLDIGSEPPRFAYYRQARAEMENDYDDSTITEDELAYALKRKLRVTPEARYQHEKRNYFFHDLYVEGKRECNPMYDGCTPNCRFYPEFGVIQDQEVIEEHNKLVQTLRQQNRIVDPPSESELLEMAKKEIV